MKRAISTSIKQQTGDFLIESLIGMVLMAIIGMGIVHVSSKAAVAQHDMRLQEIVVNHLRALLIKNRMGTVDICAGVPNLVLPDNQSVAIAAQGCDGGGTTTATIRGATIANVPKPISLSVTLRLAGQAQDQGTEIVVGGTWETL